MQRFARTAFGAWALLALGTVAQAQEGPEIGIRGRVTSVDGAAVANVLVKLVADGRTLQVRTDADGNYRMTGAAAGQYLVTMRRIGFRADTTTVQLSDRLEIVSRRLEPLAARVDGVQITEAWSGVHGVIGDRNYQPVEGATVEVVGSNDEATSSDEGQFALPQRAGASLLLRVSAPGYDPRLVSARIPEDGSVELSVLLTGASAETRPSTVIDDELERRMTWTSPMALRLTREEILATEALDLTVAVNLTPAAQRVGARVAPTACVFVDGVPRPGLPIGALRPESVEFIEVYGQGAERTGQLSRRWPPRGECGVGGSQAMLRRVSNQSSRSQFVVVWTHKAD